MTSGSDAAGAGGAGRAGARGRLDDRVALVTGGGRGIGRAICLSLARAGATVIPVSRTPGDLVAVTREVTAAGGGASADLHPADVGRCEEMERVVSDLAREGLHPDLLVTAAGVARYTGISSLDPAEWNEHLATNLTGAFHAIRTVLPGLLERGTGDVVTIVSVAGIKAFPGSGAYSASKFGLLGLTRVLREEVRAQGIRVTAIIPGATYTGLWGAEPPAPPERMISAETVAEAVLNAVTADRRAVVEEVIIRPALGDL